MVHASNGVSQERINMTSKVSIMEKHQGGRGGGSLRPPPAPSSWKTLNKISANVAIRKNTHLSYMGHFWRRFDIFDTDETYRYWSAQWLKSGLLFWNIEFSFQGGVGGLGGFKISRNFSIFHVYITRTHKNACTNIHKVTFPFPFPSCLPPSPWKKFLAMPLTDGMEHQKMLETSQVCVALHHTC